MEKRVRFKSWWLPWVLIAPQMVIVLVFFFLPAGQAVYQSALMQDAFKRLQAVYNFEILDGDRSPDAVFDELKQRIAKLLAGE